MLTAPKAPLWARWLLTLVGFAVLILLIWIAVRNGGGASAPEPSSETEANRESRIVIAEDQAPHTYRLRRGTNARVALELAIATDVRQRIHQSQLTGPLQRVRCTPAGPAHTGRRPFRCAARAAGLDYPFLGVVDELVRELTWCKRDPAPVSNAPLSVPISRRCRA